MQIPTALKKRTIRLTIRNGTCGRMPVAWIHLRFDSKKDPSLPLLADLLQIGDPEASRSPGLPEDSEKG